MMAVQAALTGPFTAASVWAALLVGLTGGFGHCIAMCGPVAASGGALAGVAGTHGSAPKRRARVALWQAAYNGGRILTYTLIGAVLGGLGSLTAVRGALGPIQQVMWLIVGEIMLFMGLAMAGVPLLARVGRSVEERYAHATRGWLARAVAALPGAEVKAALPLGMLMGLMPCGFLMSMELFAVGTGSWLAGGLTMLAFGIGTVPALGGFGLAGGLIGTRARTWLIYVGSVVVVAMGVLYIVRALSGGMAMR
jgi:sulfite exporter TauE/SafE